MPDDVIQVVNDMGIQEGMPSVIEFCNIRHESNLSDLFADDDLNNDNSNAPTMIGGSIRTLKRI